MSILSNISIATPAFLSCTLAWNIFSQPLTFNLYVSFALRWVSCRQQIEGFCFFMQSATLCLLIGSFFHWHLTCLLIDTYLLHFKPCCPVDSVFLLCYFLFLVELFPLFCACVLFFLAFCEYMFWFWFVVALFFKYVNTFLYLLALTW